MNFILFLDYKLPGLILEICKNNCTHWKKIECSQFFVSIIELSSKHL